MKLFKLDADITRGYFIANYILSLLLLCLLDLHFIGAIFDRLGRYHFIRTNSAVVHKKVNG